MHYSLKYSLAIKKLLIIFIEIIKLKQSQWKKQPVSIGYSAQFYKIPTLNANIFDIT